jgi:2-polyprenyl-3-methyl-5-hydroxy-6-metoxy-1,4-benzoquinol methylase
MTMINRVMHSRRLRSGVKTALHLTGFRRIIPLPAVSKEPLQPNAGAAAPPPEPLRTDANAVADYWTRVNVTQHHAFASAQDSLDYFHWRNDQYFPYIEYLPVDGQDGKVVLDYGCGPGHDLVGFAVYSKPKRLIGMDVSSSSLAEATARLALHGARPEMVLLNPDTTALPLDTASVDLVHCSGVIHHTPEPVQVLRELRRVLKPNGYAQVMIYNYDSLFVHLYVAYDLQIVGGSYVGMDIRDAFARTTDGPDCPISRVYKPSEFIDLCREAGFAAECTGIAISMHEAMIFPKRFEAVQNRSLPTESRKFLLSLAADSYGFPTYHGRYAGVDGCYRLRPA